MAVDNRRRRGFAYGHCAKLATPGLGEQEYIRIERDLLNPDRLRVPHAFVAPIRCFARSEAKRAACAEPDDLAAQRGIGIDKPGQ